MKTIITFFSILFLFTSCEDVIDIELNSIEPKLVIDGSITDETNSCVISLSKSGDYFEPGIYPTVSEATVSVIDQSGTKSYFEERQPGVYVSDNLRGIENTAYTLTVIAEGKEYEANVVMPKKVNISSLSYQETPQFMEFTGGYLVLCHLYDPIDVENFYRMKVYNINDDLEGNKSLYLFDDSFVDGNEVVLLWDTEQFMPQDTIVVELQTLDESTYDYYLTLQSIRENNFIGNANPADPETNISNGALGYFGAYTVSRDTITIQ